MSGKEKLNVEHRMSSIDNETTDDEAVEDVVRQDTQHYHQEDDGSFSPSMWLLLFITFMFSVPFATFYGVRHWLTNLFDLTTFQTNAFSVFACTS